MLLGHQRVVAMCAEELLHCSEQISMCKSKSRFSLISGKCRSRKKFWRKYLQAVNEHLCSRALRVPYGTDAEKSSWLQGCRLWAYGRWALYSRSEFLRTKVLLSTLFCSQNHPVKQEKLFLVPFPENLLLTFCK